MLFLSIGCINIGKMGELCCHILSNYRKRITGQECHMGDLKVLYFHMGLDVATK